VLPNPQHFKKKGLIFDCEINEKKSPSKLNRRFAVQSGELDSSDKSKHRERTYRRPQGFVQIFPLAPRNIKTKVFFPTESESSGFDTTLPIAVTVQLAIAFL